MGTMNRDGAQYALRVSDVSKRYRSVRGKGKGGGPGWFFGRKTAGEGGPGFHLDQVTLDLPMGYIMGLIGPNGAGKSTLIRLILNMTARDSGDIQVLGLDNLGPEEAIKSQLGVVFDSIYLNEQWYVEAAERVMAPFYPKWDRARYADYLKRFGLQPRQKIKKLSRGMQMKLMLAIALSHDARLLILDEPTSGLDVLSRDELMDTLIDYVSDGRHSVLLSTHITSDLEEVADFITYINAGSVYYTGPKDEFEDAFLLVKGGPGDVSPGQGSLIQGMRSYPTGFDALIRSEDRCTFLEEATGSAGPAAGGRYLFQRADFDTVMRLTGRRAGSGQAGEAGPDGDSTAPDRGGRANDRQDEKEEVL
ncbi:ABC transporter ATP-binding protein [Bifidobacterium favimelis]|uniref:ABC transporter ATP-binding protein n=1 Tax=Bifidobacterium favimelis TaxID=3122979 RepID=UPI00384B75A3